MAPTLMHLGGRALSLPVIRWAHEAGLEVAVTDPDPAAPAAARADRFEPIRSDDVEALLALALELHADSELIGVHAPTDAGLIAVAAIGEATGAPANSLAAVRLTQDRIALREIWDAHGVMINPWRRVEHEGDLPDLLDQLGLPCLLQTADARSGLPARTARTEDEALLAYRELSAGGPVLLEAWAAGPRLGVNAFFRDGAYIPCGLAEYFLSSAPHRIPTRVAMPSGRTRPERRCIHALIERAVRAAGLHCGPVKADLVWTGDGPRLLDVAARFQDEATSVHTSPLVYGKSPVQAWLATLADAGGPFDTMPTEPREAAGWAAILAPRPGTLAAIRGVEAARGMDGIEDVTLVRRPGDVIRDLGDESAVVAYVWARGWDAAEVQTRLRRAQERMKVDIEWRSVA